MFIRTLLAICFLATSLASAQRPPKVRSKISDEGLSAIFGEGDNRGREARKEDCTSLAQNCISGPNDESLRSQLEGAKQRFCGRTLGADCEAGDGGGEAGNNDGGGLERRRNHRGWRNKDWNQGEGEDDRDEPSSTSSDLPSQRVSTLPLLQTPLPSKNPSPRLESKQAKVCALAPTPTNAPMAPCLSSPPLLANPPGQATPPPPPPSAASTITSTTTTQPIISLQTTTTTVLSAFCPNKNNDDDYNTNSSSNITMADDSIISTYYYRNWTLFCTDKTKDAIRSEKRERPKGCDKCEPRESMKKWKKEKRDKEKKWKKEKKKVKELLCRCGDKVLTKWPKEFEDLLEMLAGVANETEKGRAVEKERGLKFGHGEQASGALGSGDFGRIVRLLGMALGIGSALWVI